MSTRNRLIKQYNRLSRRPDIANKEIRDVISKSFDRSLGRFLPPNKNSRILDIACGEGAFLLYLLDSGYTHLAGFNLSEENVRICHSLGLNFVDQFDALQLSDYPGRDFDFIVALDILEHLPKELAAKFVEAARDKLGAQGTLLIQTPNMGSIFSGFSRYNDLSHEFCLTEKSAVDLLMVAGFEQEEISVFPVWNATTRLGYLREFYLRICHKLIYLAEDSARPLIPTKNLMVVGRR